MDILLDTHALWWFLSGTEKMPDTARETILNPGNTIYVSIASVWEVAIKMSIGKLNFEGGLDGFSEAIENEGFALLDITTGHIKAVKDLPFVHRDPFDRMLAAQAIVEGLSVMTADADMKKYDINSIW